MQCDDADGEPERSRGGDGLHRQGSSIKVRGCREAASRPARRRAVGRAGVGVQECSQAGYAHPYHHAAGSARREPDLELAQQVGEPAPVRLAQHAEDPALVLPTSPDTIASARLRSSRSGDPTPLGTTNERQPVSRWLSRLPRSPSPAISGGARRPPQLATGWWTLVRVEHGGVKPAAVARSTAHGRREQACTRVQACLASLSVPKRSCTCRSIASPL